MTESIDAFRRKLFETAGMPYTKPDHAKAANESVGASKLENLGRRTSTAETLPGSPIRKPSLSGQLDVSSRRMSSAQPQSPVVHSFPTAGSRRSTVLADLDAASPFSLASSANFYTRQKAVKEALVQSIVRRQERNEVHGNSLFLFPSNRNHANAGSSAHNSCLNEVPSSNDELEDSIADFVKLGVQVSSSWLQEELRISPTAKKRFEIFRNPTPEFLDDPVTPKLGMRFMTIFQCRKDHVDDVLNNEFV
jgi:hypothetical protein